MRVLKFSSRFSSILCATVVCVLLAACTEKSLRPPADAASANVPPREALQAVVRAINVLDDRADVADPERTLYMPEAGFVGKQYNLTPALTAGDRQVIENEVRTHFTPGEREVSVDVYVVDGQQSFKIGEMKETLSLEFVVRIEVVNQADPSDVATAVGKSDLVRQGVHLERDTVPSLYSKTIRESVKDGFAQLVGRASR